MRGLQGKTMKFAIALIASLIAIHVHLSSEPYTDAVNNESNLTRLVNQQRSEHGIHSLSELQELNDSAMNKCEHMQLVKPDGLPHDWEGYHFAEEIRDEGFTLTVGENLSRGYRTDNTIMNAWLDSPPHKGTILDERFNYIGHAQCDGHLKNLTVQHFAQ